MSDKSSIEWTATANADGSITPGSTWNPTRGCTKIAQGCKNCYAERFAERFRAVPGHPYEQGFDPRLAAEQLTLPLTWKKPRRIFVDSMSDLFHEAFPFEYIDLVFAVMALAPQHTFQVLTKRPERAAAYFASFAGDFAATAARGEACAEWIIGTFGVKEGDAMCERVIASRFWKGLPNVWIGTSIAEQKDADRNIPYLLQIPAAVRFLSVEPLISSVNLRRITVAKPERPPYAAVPVLGDIEQIDCLRGEMVQGRLGFGCNKINWVIVGGESGPKARPCDVAWIRSVAEQCTATGVPVFVKQLGAKPIDSSRGVIECANEPHATKCNAVILRDRKGGDWSEWPEDLRIRQFPEVA